MNYPVIIHKDDATGYGVTIPDVPGCFAYGDTQEEAILNIQETVELYYHGEDISEPPTPSQMEDLLKSDLYTKDSFLYLANIDFAFIAPKTQRINITVPEYKLVRIDRAAKARGLSRSAFFVDSAEQHIRNLGIEKTKFYERLSSWEDSVVRDSGLSTAQAHTIEIVGHAGQIKMKDLAQKIGVTTGTLTVAVDRLEEKQLLIRQPCKTDRRAYLIELTESGRAYFKQHHNFHIKMTQEIVADLTDEEQQIFGTILEKMLKKI